MLQCTFAGNPAHCFAGVVTLRFGFRPVVLYQRCKKVSEDCVHSMMGVHQIPNTRARPRKYRA